PGRGGESPQLGSLREIRIETAMGLEDAEEWEVPDMAVDSGASATILGERMLKAITLQPGRAGFEYEAADGSKIPNLPCQWSLASINHGLHRTPNQKSLLHAFSQIPPHPSCPFANTAGTDAAAVQRIGS
ncbi:MAG: hypothetical protein ACPGR4_08870, partial [Paracoccaceae bacterium]